MTNNLRSMRVNLAIALEFSRQMTECLYYSANATKRYEGSSHLFSATFMFFNMFLSSASDQNNYLVGFI